MIRIPPIAALLALAACLAVHGAAWSQAPSSSPVPDTLAQRVIACAACHGEQGEGLRTNEYYPRIAGKPAGYLFNQLVYFRERRRHSPVMNYMVSFLSDAYLREIADYYSKLAVALPPPAPVPSSELVARGEALVLRGDKARQLPACASCHGEALTGMEPAIPGLVGLDPQYVAAQMGAWRNKMRRAREPDCMANIASVLVPGDEVAIAAWLASRPAQGKGAPLAAGSLKLPAECGGLDVR
jgi:cytochrome c553